MAIATRHLETDPLIARLLETQEELCRLLERDQREFFLDLLAGRALECLLLQGRRLGHDLEEPHWPLVFRTGADPGGRARPVRHAGDPAGRLEQAVRDGLREVEGRGGPAPVVGIHGDGVVVFLPDGLAAGPAQLASRVKALAARRGLPVLAGWGPRCDDPGSFGAGVARARWVVDVLAGMPGEPAPAGYDDLGIYGLLYEKRDRDQLADFAVRWLGPLREHTELTHTLRVFLETGGPSAAASALFVHISTLKYRLRKIESILGVDLSDPEACFNLRLAFKILTVQERLAAGSNA